MKSATTLNRCLWAVCLAGALLHAYTAVFRSDGPYVLFLTLLFLWSCVPYGVAWQIGRSGKAAAALGFAMAALTLDGYMYYEVFVAPKSSTAALGLLFMPLWNTLIFGPIGALLAVLLVRVLGRRQA